MMKTLLLIMSLALVLTGCSSTSNVKKEVPSTAVVHSSSKEVMKNASNETITDVYQRVNRIRSEKSSDWMNELKSLMSELKQEKEPLADQKRIVRAFDLVTSLENVQLGDDQNYWIGEQKEWLGQYLSGSLIYFGHTITGTRIIAITYPWKVGNERFQEDITRDYGNPHAFDLMRRINDLEEYPIGVVDVYAEDIDGNPVSIPPIQFIDDRNDGTTPQVVDPKPLTALSKETQQLLIQEQRMNASLERTMNHGWQLFVMDHNVSDPMIRITFDDEIVDLKNN